MRYELSYWGFWFSGITIGYGAGISEYGNTSGGLIAMGLGAVIFLLPLVYNLSKSQQEGNDGKRQ